MSVCVFTHVISKTTHSRPNFAKFSPCMLTVDYIARDRSSSGCVVETIASINFATGDGDRQLLDVHREGGGEVWCLRLPRRRCAASASSRRIDVAITRRVPAGRDARDISDARSTACRAVDVATRHPATDNSTDHGDDTSHFSDHASTVV